MGASRDRSRCAIPQADFACHVSAPGFKSDDVLGYEYGLQFVLNPLTNAMILWGIGEQIALTLP